MPYSDVLSASSTLSVVQQQQLRRVNTALSTLPDFVYAFDNEGRFTYANSALLALWKKVMPEILGRNHFELNYSPELATQYQREIRSVLETGQSFRGESLYTRGEGSPRFFEYIFVPVFGSDGQVESVAGSARDITERKQADTRLQERAAEIEALNLRLRRSMTETHHRVKNNLQVISAMIEMQVADYEDAQAVPLEKFLQFKTHVHTLSIVHDLLTKSVKESEQAERISAKAVLEHLLPLLKQTIGDGKAFHYTLDEAQLTSQQCIALSLVLNELVSNALKHGEQEAAVTFRVEEANAVLTVSDDGAGFPADFDALKSANTGLDLVVSLVRSDLNGKIRFATRPQGGGQVTVTFALPQDSE